MKNITRIVGIIAMIAVIGFGFVSCDSPEEKAAKAAAAAAEQAAKAAEEAASGLLTALQGSDPAALQEALKAGGSAAIAALTSTSASPGGDFAYNLNETGDGIIINKYSGAGGLVIIPAEIEGYPVVEIANSAFLGSTQYDLAQGINITGVVIPENVVSIGERAFRSCANLETVILPETLTTIGKEAFVRCVKLHTVNLPAGITDIDNGAFFGCENLYNLTISDSITSIDFRIIEQKRGYHNGTCWYQFSGCGKLPLAIRQRLKDLSYTGKEGTF